MRHTLASGDAPRVRLAVACLIAILVWLGCLVELGRWLARPTLSRIPDPPLEMRVVEMESPPPLLSPSPPALARPSSVKSAQPVRPRLRSEPPPPKSLAPPNSALRSTHIAPPAPSVPEPAQAKSPVPAPAAPSVTTPASPAPSGDSAARPVARQLPELPDDLREQAFQTVATARFAIHADGSVEVELLKPTPNPRLNQILLEALRQWRFFPAMQAGRPVESRQDIRVHFNVD